MVQNSMLKILPFWNSNQIPPYYTRSSTVYARVDIKEHLQRRGVYNTTVTNLAKHLPQGAFVAGGFVAAMIRGPELKPSDIDIFFSSEDAFMKTYDLFANPPVNDGYAFQGYKTETTEQNLLEDSQTMRLVKFTSDDPSKLPIQLIKMVWYDNADAVIDSFDFTVCQFAIDGPQIVFNPMSMMDLFKNRLVQHRCQYPAETLYRIIKYVKKGYGVSPNSIIEMVESIRKCDKMDPPGIGKMY